MSTRAVGVMLAAVSLFLAGCVVEPARPPGFVWVPAHYVYGPYGPYWVDADWRAN